MIEKAEPAEQGGGKRLGRYLLRYLVAEGGMASVYLAQLPGPHGFEKWVAVKVMHRHLARNRRFVGMFLDEARLAARIHHPNVCSVLDFGEDKDEGLPYLVMEYLHGETFASVLRRGKKTPPPRWFAARVVTDAARGLHSAHEIRSDDGQSLGVVHRDVSPQNIIVLYDGLAKAVDFGVASLRGRVGETKSGELKGKIRYMAPEQLRRETVDRRADIWALGVVLWESTVGRRLFRSDSEGAVVLDVIDARIPKPSDLVAGFPPLLEAAIMRALARDREDRTPTAAVFADEVERYLYGTGEPAGPAQVAGFMAAAFADRLSARETLLRAPPLPVDSVPEVDLGGEDGEHESAPSSASLPAVARPGRRWPLLAGAAGVLAVVAVLAGMVIGLLGSDSDRRGRGHSEVSRADISPRGADSGPAADASSPEDARAPADGSAAAASLPDASAEAASRPEAGPATEDAGRAPTGTKLPIRPEVPRPEAGPPGRLNLLAIPPAEVFSRGRSLGRTPLFNVSMPAGRHTLVLRPIGGGPSKTITVRVRPGETVRESVRLGS